MSSSPGGVVRVCPCMEGTGRVNESDPSLPCVGEFWHVYDHSFLYIILNNDMRHVSLLNGTYTFNVVEAHATLSSRFMRR